MSMAFLQSSPAREPFLKAPASVITLIGILIAAHAARVLAPAALSEHWVTEYAFIPLRYSSHAADAGSVFDRAIPFVSYMFLHADATHVIINCLWLLAFGTIVARRFRPALFFLFFLTCGVAAALTHLAFNWNSADPVIGASGGIAGLMAAGVRMLSVTALQRAELPPRLLSIFAPQVLMFSALWVGVNLLFGLTGISFAGESNAIAWQAHLGGYFVGLLLAGPFDVWATRTDRNPAPLA
ncbi:MAG TPA: rhomboid family intramembrane serine protease [Rhizomicrobium sp.]|jgi:membrane associated rhomboid family serine protease|nr:rhomboid family intramembrane serine protease [Rhizomicrobium sp.]